MAELLVVVLLVAVAGTLAVAAWDNMRSSAETLAAARLSHQFIVQARMLSVYRGVNHFVVLDPATRQVAIHEDSGTVAGSFDDADPLVRAENWPVSVSLTMSSASALANPLGGSTITSEWSLPMPDSSARWGTALRGVMTTPAGVIQSASNPSAPIATGVMIFSSTTGQVSAVGLRGQFGTVKSYRLQGSSWMDLG